MFDRLLDEIELPETMIPSLGNGDEAAYLLTLDELASGWTQPDRHLLPHDLESIPPGPFLAAIVATVDRSHLNGHDVVRLMQAEARLESSAAASKLASIAEVAFCPPGNADSPVERSAEAIEYAAAEIAAGLTKTRRAADSLLERAMWLRSSGTRVLEEMAAGRIDESKVRVFDGSLAHLDTETVDTVLDATLRDAAEMTSGQLRYQVSKQVMTADPDGARSSLHEGLRDRKVTAHSNPDFTGCLHICSSHPTETAAALRNVDRIARELKELDDPRSLDQIRADVAMDLLQGGNIGGREAGVGDVHLRVELETLASLSEHPGELAGYAPVIADIARQIALRQVDGEWTWSVTRGDAVLATGTTRYRPKVSQRRKARADYPTCVHPGCRMPAIQCDLDHRQPYSHGGRTHNDNLAPLCRYHHMMRHHTPWEYRRLSSGDHHWTSPLSHTYIAKRGPPGGSSSN